MEEFGCPLLPAMPTSAVMENLEQLYSSIFSLLDVRKHQERLVNDLKTAIANKRQVEADIAAGKPVQSLVIHFNQKRSQGAAPTPRESKRFRPS